MVEWHEQVVRHTRPSARVEHELRYAAAAPLIGAAEAWCDLGCGTGVAAAAALGSAELGRVVLVDVDEGALETAGRDLRARDVVRVHADLATDEGVRAAREALGPEPATVTCFEAIEHLETFVPLVDALVELARAGSTVVLSVPNEAYWAIKNPFHPTMWGEGAFEELRRLLPEDAVVARQVPLQGSHLVLEEDGPAKLRVPDVEPHADAVESHYVCAFGPSAGLLRAGALVAPADLAAQRSLERRRESDLALLEAQVAELRAEVGRLEQRPAGQPRAEAPAAEEPA